MCFLLSCAARLASMGRRAGLRPTLDGPPIAAASRKSGLRKNQGMEKNSTDTMVCAFSRVPRRRCQEPVAQRARLADRAVRVPAKIVAPGEGIRRSVNGTSRPVVDQAPHQAMPADGKALVVLAGLKHHAEGAEAAPGNGPCGMPARRRSSSHAVHSASAQSTCRSGSSGMSSRRSPRGDGRSPDPRSDRWSPSSE